MNRKRGAALLGTALLLAVAVQSAAYAAPVRYEDPAAIYPHVYGPIDRAAVVDVLPMTRDRDGSFRAPS